MCACVHACMCGVCVRVCACVRACVCVLGICGAADTELGVIFCCCASTKVYTYMYYAKVSEINDFYLDKIDMHVHVGSEYVGFILLQLIIIYICNS